MARSWIGDAGKAEELTQTTFIKAWSAFGNFTPGTNFKTWVLKILRNVFLDHQKSRRKHWNMVSVESLKPDQIPAAPISPPRVIDFDKREIFYDLFGDEIVRLLKKIPPEFQLAVLLCDVEGLTYLEIAEVLDIPIGTARSRIHRGRAMLADLLQAYAKNLGYIRERKS